MSQENANSVNWDEDFKEDKSTPKSGNSGTGEFKKIDFMKFDKPGLYPIRLIGKGVKFYRHWEPFELKQRLISHLSYKNEDKPWLAGFYPRETFAIHVLDRNDGSKVKVLEKGKTVFEGFSNYKKVNGVNPAHPTEAPDFVIEVTWPNGNKRQAEYKVTAKMKVSPLTEEEKASFTANHINLEEYYKSTPLDKINEAWDALPAEKQVKPKKEDGKYGKSNSTTSTSSANSNASTSSKPVKPIKEKVDTTEGDDLFDDGESEKGDTPF